MCLHNCTDRFQGSLFCSSQIETNKVTKRIKPKRFFVQGLFHRIIAQSGSFISSFCHWDKRAGLYGDRLATAMGCSGDAFVNNSTELSVKVLDCLRRIEDPMEFAGMTKLFLHYPWTGPNVWKPFVDGHFSKNPVTKFRFGFHFSHIRIWWKSIGQNVLVL